MRILTWNVWFGRHEFVTRTKALIREIAQRRPEVVALQEVTSELRTVLDGGVAGYELHGGDSPFGYDVMILTRTPVRGVESVALPSAMGRRLLVVELESGLTIATVHLESTAPCVAERVAQLGVIGPWLAAKSPDSCLVGDMNFDDFAARESDVLDESFVDVWQQLHPGEPGYTIDSVVNTMRTDLKAKVQKRIDRVFVRGARWQARSIALVGTTAIDDYVDPHTFPSDHFGLAVELEP